MSYDPAEALTEFREKYFEASGVREINCASYTKRPGDPSVDAIEVIVEPGFEPADLPAASEATTSSAATRMMRHTWPPGRSSDIGSLGEVTELPHLYPDQAPGRFPSGWMSR